MYVTISSDADAANLQQDLDKLAEWQSKWLMKFHPEKCNVLTISKKRSPSKYNYTLHGHILEHDASAKYLGCTISSDLKWGKYISTICSKANNTISFLKSTMLFFRLYIISNLHVLCFLRSSKVVHSSCSIMLITMRCCGIG
jgi:hypothetical protein